MHLEVMGSPGWKLRVHEYCRLLHGPRFEIGYGQFIDFSKNFIGKEALAQKIKNPKRKEGNPRLERERRHAGNARFHLSRRVACEVHEFAAGGLLNISVRLCRERRKSTPAISQYVGYSANARSMLSLSIVDS